MNQVLNIGNLGVPTNLDELLTVEQVRQQLKLAEDFSKTNILTLGELSVEEGYITRADDKMYPFDNEARKAMGSALSIPVPYLKSVSLGLASMNVNEALGNYPDAALEFVSDVDGHLVEVKTTDSLSIETFEAMQLVEDAIGGDAKVHRIVHGLNETVLDVFDASTEPHSAKRVGDVTFGGMRVILPKKSLAPQVGMYLHRLACTNGIVNISKTELFSIKGLTRDDVLEELGAKMHGLWSRMPSLLDAYFSLLDKTIDNPTRAAQIYGRENGITAQFINRAVEVIQSHSITNPSFAWTMYDIAQVFTGIVHDEKVKENMARKLQTLAGHMVIAAHNEARCDKCFHLVD